MARPGRRDLAEDRIRARAASTSISHAGYDGSLRNSNLHDARLVLTATLGLSCWRQATPRTGRMGRRRPKPTRPTPKGTRWLSYELGRELAREHAAEADKIARDSARARAARTPRSS